MYWCYTSAVAQAAKPRVASFDRQHCSRAFRQLIFRIEIAKI
jgi:hypothetical protein